MRKTNPADTQTVYRDAVDDRRKYPRIRLQELGVVHCADGIGASVTVHDIAPDGIQVRCDKDTARRIHPSGKGIAPGQTGPELELTVKLPLAEGQVELSFSGTMIYFALINPAMVAIGIKYRALSAAERDKLGRFIAESLIPRD